MPAIVPLRAHPRGEDAGIKSWHRVTSRAGVAHQADIAQEGAGVLKGIEPEAELRVPAALYVLNCVLDGIFEDVKRFRLCQRQNKERTINTQIEIHSC